MKEKDIVDCFSKVSIPNRKNLALVVLFAPPWPEYCSMFCQDFT